MNLLNTKRRNGILSLPLLETNPTIIFSHSFDEEMKKKHPILKIPNLDNKTSFAPFPFFFLPIDRQQKHRRTMEVDEGSRKRKRGGGGGEEVVERGGEGGREVELCWRDFVMILDVGWMVHSNMNNKPGLNE